MFAPKEKFVIMECVRFLKEFLSAISVVENLVHVEKVWSASGFLQKNRRASVLHTANLMPIAQWDGVVYFRLKVQKKGYVERYAQMIVNAKTVDLFADH
jgi:hypothetical protein